MTPRRRHKIRRVACRMAGRRGLVCLPRHGSGWFGTAITLIYMDALRGETHPGDPIAAHGRYFMGMDFGFGPDRCVKVTVHRRREGDVITDILDVTPPPAPFTVDCGPIPSQVPSPLFQVIHG